MPNTRRAFLKQVGAVAASGAAAASFSPRARAAAAAAPGGPASAGEQFVVGFIGTGRQGTNLLNAFLPQPDVRVAWVCDVDKSHAGRAAGLVEETSGDQPKTTNDLRRVLDDKDVDAVVIATPDHWHAPAMILACDAGKHVYVEKPASHNLREGRLMIDAVRRTKRVVQLGTLFRSTQWTVDAMRRLREGIIGDVLVSKAWNSQFRPDIGRKQPAPPPAGLDFDAWLGPAPATPYQSNKLHYHWRWWYDYGTGDIGNDGVHDIDFARWGLGVDTHPDRVSCSGGKYVLLDSDQEWPDTYYATFEYDLGGGKKKQLVYEQRTWSPYSQDGADSGAAFYGTRGVMTLSKRWGWKVVGADDKAGESVKTKSSGLGTHARNFLACIKDGKQPNADIEVGHLSSSLSHLGNVAVRVGRTLKFDPKTEQVVGDDEANALLKRTYRADHWAVPKNV